MKKLLVFLVLIALMIGSAQAQTYPSARFATVTAAQILGLTTPLSVAQGGTGLTTSLGPGIPNLTPISGNYRVLNSIGPSATSIAVTANRQMFIPIVVSQPTTINQLGLNVTAAIASSTFSVGIYGDNGGSGGNQPSGSLLASSSSLSGAATGYIFGSLSSAFTLQPNTIYWLSVICSAAITVRCIVSAVNVLGYNASGNIFIQYLYLAGSGSTLLTPISGSLTATASAPAGQPLIFMQ
jgi:hypothetical protein